MEIKTWQLAADVHQLLPWMAASALNVLGATVILIVGVWLASKAHLLTVRALSKLPHIDPMLRGFFGGIARYFVLTITVLAVLSQFGIQTASLVAIIGAAGLAIGLALQGTLSNLAAGVMLLIFRPFRLGHHVQVGGMDGTVKELTLFWTELVTGENVQIIIPNGSVWGQPLRNFSVYPSPPQMMEARVRVPEETKLDTALDTVMGIANDNPRVPKEPQPKVLLDRSGADGALEIVVSFAGAGDQTAAIKSEILKSAHDALQMRTQ